MEERDKAIAAQWRRRIERARYDVDLAERRYEAVDPANRLIASTLILQLANDFPRLWTAPTTAARDRKRMLRDNFCPHS
jgi:hypothetical protein